MTKLLKVVDLRVEFAGRTILEALNFSLEQGEVLGVLGSSGSGKTTLLRTLTGLIGDAAKLGGQVHFDSVNLLKLNAEDFRKLRAVEIASVFQESSAYFCPTVTIGAQLYEILRYHRHYGRAEAFARIKELLLQLNFTETEIAGILKAYPATLSGGMNQRVGIAQALLLQPRLLLADEPTSALDMLSQSEVIKLLLMLKNEWGLAQIIVSHDLAFLAEIADKIMVLHDGKCVAYAPLPDLLLHNEDAFVRRLLAEQYF